MQSVQVLLHEPTVLETVTSFAVIDVHDDARGIANDVFRYLCT